MCNPCEETQTKSSHPDRRTFLKSGSAVVGATAWHQLVPAMARPSKPPRNPKILVVVFLRGGADGLNLVAPTNDAEYYNLRGNIGVPAPNSGRPGAGLPLDPANPTQSAFSFHPGLTRLHQRYLQPQARLAVVHAAGYLGSNRSHFVSQDIVEMGNVGMLGLTTGWINRYLGVAQAGSSPVRALALNSQLPKSMQGPTSGAFAVKSTAQLRFPADSTDERWALEYAVSGDAARPTKGLSGVYASMRETFDLIDYMAAFDPTQYPAQHGAVYPTGSKLGQSLREVGQLIRANLGIEVFQVENAGWDHHCGLVGQLADYASDLDAALGEFMIDMGPLMDDIVFVTVTDFGREVRENGCAGADHGMGQAMFVGGGAVRGGDPGNGTQVHGAWPGLLNLAEQRYLDPVNDYRDVFSEVLADHLGLPPQDLGFVFPGHTYQPLGII